MYLLIILIIIGSRYAQVGLKEELNWLRMEKECLLTMGLLKMGQFPRDLNIKEISMINITLQRIGIYYRDREWGKQCFEKIISEIPKEMIDRISNNKNEMYCHLINGDSIRAVRAGDGARGCKFTGAIVQDDVTRRVLEEIIYPCVRYPVSIISNPEDVTATYATIKQELSRQEVIIKKKDKKFVKIKVRY